MEAKRIALLAGATSYISISLAQKAGPFQVFSKLRAYLSDKYGEDKHPLHCPFCTSFYVGSALILIDDYLPQVTDLFGVIGLANAVRGASNEF